MAVLIYLYLLATILPKASPSESCSPYSACPPACRCYTARHESDEDNSEDLIAICDKTTINDDQLNSLLLDLPHKITVLHIDVRDAEGINAAAAESSSLGRNNFSATRDFGRFTELKDLRLRHGSIRSLGKRLFEKLSKLETLDASHNVIDHVTLETFGNLKGLQTMVLDYNQLGRNNLPSSAFMYLLSLRKLSLQYNGLRSINSNAFAGLKRLEKLHLDGNPLERLSPTFFSFLPNLKELSLSDCSLRIIPNALFIKAPPLENLNLAQNPFIPGGLPNFNPIHSLRVLDLSSCSLGSLNPESFEGMSLFSLNLGYNRFGTNPKALTTALNGLLSVNKISLSFNGFKTFTTDYIPERIRTGIRSLDLSGNPLYHIRQQTLNGLFSLQSLNIAQISLESLPIRLPKEMNDLLSLNISNNGINRLTIVSQMAYLQLLDVSNCRLEAISEKMATFMANLSVVLLQDNPWSCQCGIMPLYRTLHHLVMAVSPTSGKACPPDPGMFAAEENVRCFSPSPLSGRRLIDLDPSNIPSSCSAIFGAVGLSSESETGILVAAGCSVLLIFVLGGAVACSFLWPKLASGGGLLGPGSRGSSKANVSRSSSEQSEELVSVEHSPSADMPGRLQHKTDIACVSDKLF